MVLCTATLLYYLVSTAAIGFHGVKQGLEDLRSARGNLQYCTVSMQPLPAPALDVRYVLRRYSITSQELLRTTPMKLMFYREIPA